MYCRRLFDATVFPRIIAGGDYLLLFFKSIFFARKGGDYSREGDYSVEAIIAFVRTHPNLVFPKAVP